MPLSPAPSSASPFAEPGRQPRLRGWLDFSRDGTVTIRSGKVEYGQGVWTALAQIAAEELDVAFSRVRVAPVSTGTSPDEGVTSGSRSIEESGGALRQACAQARAVFLAAAAAKLGADVAGLAVADGQICTAVGPDGLTYWSLNEPARLTAAAGDPVPAKRPAGGRSPGTARRGWTSPTRSPAGRVSCTTWSCRACCSAGWSGPRAPAATLDHLGDPDLPAGVLAHVRDGSFLGVIAESDRVALSAAACWPRRPGGACPRRCPTRMT